MVLPAKAIQPATVQRSNTPPGNGVSMLAVSVVIVAALYLGREVFIPLVLAVLLSFVLSPVVSWLYRLGVGRVPSVIVAVLLALGLITAGGAVIGVQVADLAKDLPRYQTTVQRKMSGLQESFWAPANALIGRVERQISKSAASPAP